MKKFLLPLLALLFILMLAGILAGIEMVVHEHIKSDAIVVRNVTCQVTETVAGDKSLILKLDCQGREATVDDPRVVLNQLTNPGQLTCTVHESGKAKCQLPAEQ